MSKDLDARLAEAHGSDVAPTLVELGCDLSDAGRHHDAEFCFRRALALGVNWVSFNVGNELMAQGRPEEAVNAYQAAIAAGENDAWLNLGQCLERLGDLAGAMTAYRHADESGDKNGALALAYMLREQGEDDEAERLAQRGASLGKLQAVGAATCWAYDRTHDPALEHDLRRGAEHYPSARTDLAELGVLRGECAYSHREARAELRGAVYREDAGSLVDILTREVWPENALQLIGDGLLRVLRVPTEGIDEAAQRCVTALWDRGWEGDADLAAGLEATLGSAPVPLLRPLPVDLAELAGVLEGDLATGGGRIDLRTGDVWPQLAIDYAEEEEEDDDERWLWVECEGSPEGYRDMELFIAALDDTEQVDRLSIAIGGRGAFRRFKDQLSRWPEQLERWYAFSEDRQRGRARAWLAAEGYAPAPRPPGS